MLQIIDYIAIGGIILFGLAGVILGFGKGVKFFTGGIFGIIISVVVTYFLYGVIFGSDLGQRLLTDFSNVLPTTIRLNDWLPMLVAALGLFLVISLARIIIVKIVSSIVEINNPAMKAINRILGIFLFIGIFIAIALTVFQVSSWVYPELSSDVFYNNLVEGSVLKIDWVYTHNPMPKILEYIQK